jgi:hypothetical protein
MEIRTSSQSIVGALPSDAGAGWRSARPLTKQILTALLYACSIAAWVGGTTIAFYLKDIELFASFDGAYARDLARRQFEWHLPLFSVSMDWYQGLGDIFFGVNFRLLPEFIAGSFFGSTILAKVVTYEVSLLELCFGVTLFACALGMSRRGAIAGALVTSLLFLPFSNPSLLYQIAALAPQYVTFVSGALLAGAAFLVFGRRNWRSDLPFAIIVLAVLAWQACASTFTFVLTGPFFLLCAISGTFGAATAAERRCKIGLICAAVLLLMAGPAVYFTGNILDTAAVIFNTELPNDRATFYLTSILFHWRYIGPAGPLLVGFAVCGALLATLDRTNRTLRVFAITLLTYLGSRLLFAALIVRFDFWRGPAPLYFEFFVIPVYAIFAAHFWGHLIRAAWRFGGWAWPDVRVLEAGILCLGAAAVLTVAALTPSRSDDFRFPPAATPITRYLAQGTELRPGSVFRGRVANMDGRSIDGSLSPRELHQPDRSLPATGNPMRQFGLHYFGVPELYEYTPTITPFFHAVTTRTLALPGDRQQRSVLLLRDFNPRILAMLGVRFVVTDREFDGPADLRMSFRGAGQTYFVYEIVNPNLGNYSPTVVHSLSTASEIIARLQDTAFDPTREIIGDLPVSENELVPASNARLTFDGASLRLQADSSGRSILLVPLEFSHCLKAASTDDDRLLLFRANLVETGILFSGRLDAALSLDTGPFLNPACRLRDFFDARALHVDAVPPRRAPAP